jgi:hypothetical protein
MAGTTMTTTHHDDDDDDGGIEALCRGRRQRDGSDGGR